MNQAVYQALSTLGGPKAEGLVFRKRDGRGWGSIRTAFEAACREAKVWCTGPMWPPPGL